MDILISKTSMLPIYEQIKNQIKQTILQGRLIEGDILPSIRELAKQLQVSVITTKRAYEDLEREGYVTSLVGKGTYVAKQNTTILREKQLSQIKDCIRKTVNESKLINLSLDDIQMLVKEAYKEES